MRRSTLVWEVIILASIVTSLLAGFTYWMDHGLGKTIVKVQDILTPQPSQK